MPRAPRRSRKEKKVLVDWVPALASVLNQGYLELTGLVALYQTGKAVHVLFTTFPLRMETQNTFCVPDLATWRKIFQAFKTQSFLADKLIHDKRECSRVIHGLIICGHIKLAFDVQKQLDVSKWTVYLQQAILINGSKAVNDKCVQMSEWLEKDWIEDHKPQFYPEVPLFSTELAETTELWTWFIDGRGLHYDGIVDFIMVIGRYRSTVALAFLVNSLDKIVFKDASNISPTATLIDVLFYFDTTLYFAREGYGKLCQLYKDWNDPNARRFVDLVVNPLGRHFGYSDSSE